MCDCDGYAYIGPGDPYCDYCAHHADAHDGDRCHVDA